MDDYKKRVSRFKSECGLFDLPFLGIERVYPTFWDSLFDIVAQKPHEQQTIQNGIIFVKDFNEKSFKVSGIGYEVKDYYLDNSADGKRVFLLSARDDTQSRTIIFNSDLTQTELLSFVERKGSSNVIITRCDMEIRVFYRGTLSVLENRDWMVYKSKEGYINDLYNQDVQIPRYFERLLVFAFYDLAVDKIGTTLVFCEDNGINPSNLKAKKPHRDIYLNNDAELALLKKYIMNHDGAIFINSENKVSGISAKLAPKENSIEAVDKIHHFGGMRHTSSAAYSYEHPNVLVITTSDDGGATLFKDGRIILSTKYKSSNESEVKDVLEKQHDLKKEKSSSFIDNSSDFKLGLLFGSKVPSGKDERNDIFEYFDSIQNMAEKFGDESETGYTTTKCPKCGQNYKVGYIRIPGWNDHEELRCVKCGTNYYSKSCFELKGEPIYKLEKKS